MYVSSWNDTTRPEGKLLPTLVIIPHGTTTAHMILKQKKYTLGVQMSPRRSPALVPYS